MFLRRWHEHAPVIGTAAQWAGGFAAFGTFCVALWGVSKAVPYFENMMLREDKAELELNVRALRKEKSDLEGALTSQKERLMSMAASERGLQFEVACSYVDRVLQSNEKRFGDGELGKLLRTDNVIFSFADFALKNSKLQAGDRVRVSRAWVKLRDENRELRSKRLLIEERKSVADLEEMMKELRKVAEAHGGRPIDDGPVSIVDEGELGDLQRLRVAIVLVCLGAQKDE